MAEKKTKREMFLEMAEMEANLPYRDFLMEQVEQLDRRNEKAKERKAQKAKESDAMREAIAALLTENLQTAAELTSQLEDTYPEISRAKVTARMKLLIEEGIAGKMQVKTEDGRRVMAYCVASALPATEE